MNIRNSIVAIAAVSAALFAAPASAAQTWNGQTWNGQNWNGQQWNGQQWNGQIWNGERRTGDSVDSMRRGPSDCVTGIEPTCQTAPAPTARSITLADGVRRPLR